MPRCSCNADLNTAAFVSSRRVHVSFVFFLVSRRQISI
ncbi:unnamed protein product [Brassica napus]|uniref:(rape) hypothetical protein n=1 Tax=Brassica napus TaxID=3708 RepID=A0A816VNV2_BRANA|nr:unnamed protein product [Brassica napus]